MADVGLETRYNFPNIRCDTTRSELFSLAKNNHLVCEKSAHIFSVNRILSGWRLLIKYLVSCICGSGVEGAKRWGWWPVGEGGGGWELGGGREPPVQVEAGASGRVWVLTT